MMQYNMLWKCSNNDLLNTKNMNIKQLIEDVITNLANNSPLESVSSKVQVISRLLKNDKFKKWVDCEFVYGYKFEDEIPNYRVLYIIGVQADYIAPAPGGMINSPTK